MKRKEKSQEEFAEWLRYRNGVLQLCGVGLARANQEADLHIKKQRTTPTQGRAEG